MNLKEMLKRQNDFSRNYYNAEELSEQEKIDKHKTLCLAMHSELSQLANSVHFREHRPTITPTHRQNILFETMDVYRYCLSILNLWGYTEVDAINAFKTRDSHLNVRTEKNWSKWKGEPVVVVDVDDVIGRFRQNFYRWINKTYDQKFDEKSHEYFISETINGKSGDALLQEFVDAGCLRDLDVCQNVLDGLKKMRDKGYWIHILTARPESELKCLNETYSWLSSYVKEFDSVQFSSEKYIAISGLKAYAQGKILCAIDDSPKHAAEYSMHGVKCLVPKRSYNKGVWNNDNILPFDWETSDISSLVQNIRNSIQDS